MQTQSRNSLSYDHDLVEWIDAQIHLLRKKDFRNWSNHPQNKWRSTIIETVRRKPKLAPAFSRLRQRLLYRGAQARGC